jgi:PIN domain nuclease of toxin-antitoxin system
MRILLDTCTFLWLALDEPQLSTAAREVFTDPLNEVFLSAASAFEIAVKQELGRLPLPQPAQRYVPRLREAHLVQPLALDEESALHAASLPALHRDPFDRLLVAQAIVHGLVLLTPDEDVRRYPVRTLW